MKKSTAILAMILTLIVGMAIGGLIQTYLVPGVTHYEWLEHRIERFA